MTSQVKKPLEAGNTCYLIVMDRRFLSEIRDVGADTIWVSFPAADYPIAGMGVEVEFHDSGGLTRYHTRVVIGPKKKGDGIVLQRAEAATYLKHRRSWRVPVNFPAKVKENEGGQEREARLLDLIGQGALIHAAPGLEVGNTITLTFTLPGSGFPHAFEARVIHVRPVEPAGTHQYGLHFGKVSTEAREVLTWFLWKSIQQRYPEEIRALYPRNIPPPSRKKEKKARDSP